jgi:hypothetical protein
VSLGRDPDTVGDGPDNDPFDHHGYPDNPECHHDRYHVPQRVVDDGPGTDHDQDNDHVHHRVSDHANPECRHDRCPAIEAHPDVDPDNGRDPGNGCQSYLDNLLADNEDYVGGNSHHRYDGWDDDPDMNHKN